MTQSIESITTAALGLALDAASQRQQIHAMNIANASAVGYTPMQADFVEQMADVRRQLDSGQAMDAYALSAFQNRLVPMLDANGQPAKVQLDDEVARMSQNAVQYQALVKGLSRHLALLGLAASDGKR